MNPKEIRKSILEVLYKNRSKDFFSPNDLLNELKISDEELDNEIRYLSEKYFIKIVGGEFCGQQFLNFVGVKITADGVDLVEDPEEFRKLFTIKVNNNNFGDINHSNLNVNSENNKQTVGIIDEGVNTVYKNIETEGFDVGMHNKGKGISVKDFKGYGKKGKRWQETWWGITIITFASALLVGFLIFWFGWN